MKNAYFLMLLCMGSQTVNALEPVLQTDWLEPRIGSSGDLLGAEVKSIHNMAGDGGTIIDISLPIENAEQYDAVEVISEESNSPLLQHKQHLWIEGYESGNYGLRLYLKRNPRIGFRVRLIDVDADNQKNR